MVFSRRGSYFRSGALWLTAPSLPVFVISALLALAALLAYYAGVTIPILNSGRIFDVLALAYLLLFIGVVVRRL